MVKTTFYTAFFFVASLLHSCASLDMDTVELELISLDMIKREQVRAVIGDEYDLPSFSNSARWGDQPYNLKARFYSNKNLDSSRDSLFKNVVSYFCEFPSQMAFIADPGLYQGGINVGSQEYVAQSNLISQPEGNLVYEVIINISDSEIRKIQENLRIDQNQIFYMTYNLGETPMDICLYVHGANYSYGSKTPVLKISKEKIQESLSSLGPE